MKYTIHGYSQEKSIESGLDYLDLGILRWIQDFYPAMKKTIFQNKEYGWFSYSYFLNELPIIGINTKAGLRKRIDKIIEKGFIERTCIKDADDKLGTRSWIRLTEKMLIIISQTTVSTGGNHSFHPIATTVSTGGNHSFHNSSINNPSINHSSFSRKDITTASGSSFNENLVNLFMQEKYPYLEPITASTLKSFVNNMLKEEQKQKGIEITKEHAYTFFAEIITKFFPNINENSVSVNNAHTQTTYQGNLDNSTGKKNLTVEAVKTSKAELQKQDEIENFVNEHNSFNENEVALITEYIIDRKTIYKSKVKNTKQALNGLLCDIAEVKKQIPLEWVFQKDGDIYSNCGTAGDKTKPFQTIKIDYFKNVLQQDKQKATTNRMLLPSKIDITLNHEEELEF